MSDIFSILPDIIIYIVLGYIFLRVFRIVKIVKNSDNYEHILVESLVFGFVIKNTISLIPFSFGYYIDIIGMSMLSVLLGYLFAKLFENKYVLKFIDLLKIKHTKHKFMWQNIEDPDYAFFVDVTNPDTNIRYFGQLIMYEEFERFPMIQLCRYINWDNSDLLNDYSNDPTRTVLIDTSKYSEIDITYQKCSDFIKRWS